MANKRGGENFVDISGKRFGRLTALERAENSPCGATRWICVCDCGAIKNVQYSNLTSGQIKSCGCLNSENRMRRNIKHGGSFRGHTERLYTVWRGMLERCYNKKNISYKYYGEKGVSVCDEWKSDFSKFREWAIRNGYDETAKRGDCTLDRIDPTGNYEPSNCRWVDMMTQNHNRRRDLE